MTRNNFVALIFSFLVLEVFTFINSFVTNLKGGSVDAERFQDLATEWSRTGEWQFAINAEFYIQFLGIIYWIFGPSEFMGAQFGIFAVIVACLYFVKINWELGVTTPSVAILAFLLWPSFLLRVTTTMREPYMVLLLVLTAYYLIVYQKRRQNLDLVKLFSVLLFSVLFHKATAVLFVAVVFYIVFFVMKQQAPTLSSKTFYIRVGIILLTFGGGALSVLMFSELRGLKPAIALLTSDTEYMAQVIDYKKGREFRATYDAALDVSSPVNFFISAPKTFLYYMCYPFPWKIQTPIDVLASLEGLIRFAAMGLIFWYSFVRNKFPIAARPLFVLGILFCCIWAAGTANYGTASRHHVTTNWIFIISYILFYAHILKRDVPPLFETMMHHGSAVLSDKRNY